MFVTLTLDVVVVVDDLVTNALIPLVASLANFNGDNLNLSCLPGDDAVSSPSTNTSLTSFLLRALRRDAVVAVVDWGREVLRALGLVVRAGERVLAGEVLRAGDVFLTGDAFRPGERFRAGDLGRPGERRDGDLLTGGDNRPVDFGDALVTSTSVAPPPLFPRRPSIAIYNCRFYFTYKLAFFSKNRTKPFDFLFLSVQILSNKKIGG